DDRAEVESRSKRHIHHPLYRSISRCARSTEYGPISRCVGSTYLCLMSLLINSNSTFGAYIA
ncbi:uncharacterized protein J3R85_000636, partial [Psidium guajava]